MSLYQKSLRKIGFLATGLIIVLASCHKQPPPVPEESDYYVIAYVAGWNDEPLSYIPATRLTHINYAFLNIRDGKVVSSMENDSVNLIDLVDLKSLNPDLKILCSIGGATWSEDFSDAAFSDSSRKIFSNSLIHFIEKYNLDGADIDWEFPGVGDGSRHEDKENFTLLLQQIRADLNDLAFQENRLLADPYLLTIASGASSWYLALIEVDKILSLLDYLNIMTYDFYGSWSSTTGNHTNLYRSDLDPLGISVSESVQAYLNNGVPREKIVIGAAFYGRYWEGVTKQDHGLYKSFSGNSGAFTYSYIKNTLLNDPDYVRFWDDHAKAPWLWNESSGIFISYDDQNSISSKTDFVRLNKLGGMMFWEYTDNPEGELLETIYKGLNN